jgi:hypothetical protein
MRNKKVDLIPSVTKTLNKQQLKVAKRKRKQEFHDLYWACVLDEAKDCEAGKSNKEKYLRVAKQATIGKEYAQSTSSDYWSGVLLRKLLWTASVGSCISICFWAFYFFCRLDVAALCAAIAVYATLLKLITDEIWVIVVSARQDDGDELIQNSTELIKFFNYFQSSINALATKLEDMLTEAESITTFAEGDGSTVRLVETNPRRTIPTKTIFIKKENEETILVSINGADATNPDSYPHSAKCTRNINAESNLQLASRIEDFGSRLSRKLELLSAIMDKITEGVLEYELSNEQQKTITSICSEFAATSQLIAKAKYWAEKLRALASKEIEKEEEEKREEECDRMAAMRAAALEIRHNIMSYPDIEDELATTIDALTTMDCEQTDDNNCIIKCPSQEKVATSISQQLHQERLSKQPQ